MTSELARATPEKWRSWATQIQNRRRLFLILGVLAMAMPLVIWHIHDSWIARWFSLSTAAVLGYFLYVGWFLPAGEVLVGRILERSKAMVGASPEYSVRIEVLEHARVLPGGEPGPALPTGTMRMRCDQATFEHAPADEPLLFLAIASTLFRWRPLSEEFVD